MLMSIRNMWRMPTSISHFGQFLAQQSQQNSSKLCRNYLSTQSIVSEREQRLQPLCGLTHAPKNTFLSSAPVTHQSVRTKVRVYYKGSAWKRYNKHNIEKRLTTPGGLEILWRRVLKGRHQLAVYERILPNTVDGKILAPHQFRYQDHPLTKKKLPKPGLF